MLTDDSRMGDKEEIGVSHVSQQGKSLQSEVATAAAVLLVEAKLFAQIWINPSSCYSIEFISALKTDFIFRPFIFIWKTGPAENKIYGPAKS